MKYTHILQTDKIQKDFYLMIIKKMIKNLLKLFNETDKNDKNSVLAVLYGVFPKRIFKKEGFIFSNTMYRTAKRNHFSIKKGYEQLIKKQKNSKKQKMS